MAPRSRRPARKARRGKKALGRRRRARGLVAPKMQLKHYTYNFKLSPQAINASLTTADTVILNNNSPLFPIQATGLSGALSNSLGFAGLTDWSAACTHQLSDVLNASNFTQMYDAYRINYVTVTVEYLSNAVTPTSNSILPTFYMYWDQDDAVQPPNVRNILGKQGVKKWQPTSSSLQKRFTFKPQLAVAVESDAAGVPTQVVVPGRSHWIDCSTPRVPHYAFKIYCQDFTSLGVAGAYNVVRLHYTYNVSFRSPLICS